MQNRTKLQRAPGGRPPSWSWLPARPAAPPSRRSRAISRAVSPAAVLGLLLAAAALPVAAATPAPHSSATPVLVRHVDLTKIQPKALLPKRREHQEFTVEINDRGQVTRVRSMRGDGDPTFKEQTYGNALQSFIRTPDGKVVVGTYRLTYDYDPKTARVRRTVALVSEGGVNPQATGAVDDLMRIARKHAPSGEAQATAAPIDPRSLPDLGRITAPTPTPKPH